MSSHRTFCRICPNACAMIVEVENGRAVKAVGDPEDPLSRGYSCVKGRAQPAFLAHPDRLLGSLKRGDDGRFVPISTGSAISEIAERLKTILDEHGPRAFAIYRGTVSFSAAYFASPFLNSLLAATGSPLVFNTNTIDKGGKDTALAMHGRWMAPSQGFDEPEAVLLIGINPVVTYTGFPAGSPRWWSDNRRSGVKSIVIDPRRSDAARLAWLHLQPRPGCDVHILAAMLRTVIGERLYDAEFVAENAAGLDTLRAAVETFSPEAVGRFADVPPEDIVKAARAYAGARRGYTMAGTGPHMSGPGTLMEYLVLCLETLCGRWLRAGERTPFVATLTPAGSFRAQAKSPRDNWAFGEKMRVRGLSQSDAGLPVAALPDEILTPGSGQVRAMIVLGGNPAAAFPDHDKTVAALKSLDLLVQIDPWMSETAQHADYVIAPPMPLEAAASTLPLDMLSGLGKSGYGSGQSYGNYTPAVATPPDGSDLIEEWRFFHELKTALGHPAEVAHPLLASAPALVADSSTTTDDVLEWMSFGSRVPLAEVKAAGAGAIYPGDLVVQGKEPGWLERLELAHPLMMADLAPYADSLAGPPPPPEAPYRLVCRREPHVYNTSCGNTPETNHGRPYNPAYLHPDDLADLGVAEGDLIEISSDLGVIPAVVGRDNNLRRGLVSMMFGFGGGAERDAEVREIGSNPNRLIPNDLIFDRYTGQPRMSNVPVHVSRLRREAPAG